MKNFLRKEIICLLIISLISINISYGYSPSTKETKRLEKVKTKIEKIYNKNGINSIIKLKDQVNILIEKNKKNDRNTYILREIKNNLLLYIPKNDIDQSNNIIENETPIKEENGTSVIDDSKKAFLDNYGKEISGDIADACIKNYDFIDNIAKEQNFPTALIIAFWKKEHNCYLDNPANGWGAFQITSAYYRPGEITLDEFKVEIIDFINFAKNKISYYDKDYGKFKTYFGNEDINLTYYEYNIRDLRLVSLLYNGIRTTTNLETFEFANGNLNSSIKTNSDGIVTTFLKVLKRELK
ncbi:MAG: hypothetical protein PHR68_04005 [Candidatus Gracilibacteria bacterium]|nr:hypothetical protein [Candidatus Gracilibacteria bacterium]